MIPSMAILRVQNSRSRNRRLCLPLPLFLLWIPVLLIAPLLLIVVCAVSLAMRTNAWRIIAGFWGVLCALPGTHVHIGARANAVTVRII